MYLLLVLILCIYNSLASLPPIPANACTCSNPDWCNPIAIPAKKEVFVFWTGADDWKQSAWNWNITTTVCAFAPIPQDLMCHAHANNARVVFGADFPKNQLTNASARTAFVNSMLKKVKDNYADGVNLDIEQNQANRDSLTALTSELYHALKNSFNGYQLSFDLAISVNRASKGYDYLALSKVLDFIVPMAYDECWGSLKATANSPIKNLQKGVAEYKALGVSPNKLVLGLPWYAWKWPCNSSTIGAACDIVVPPGKQWYGWVTQISYTFAHDTMMAKAGGAAKLDSETMTKYFDYLIHTDNVTTFKENEGGNGDRQQIWFDDPTTLGAKYGKCKDLGVYGIAFWTADEVSYSEGNLAKDMWTALNNFF